MLCYKDRQWCQFWSTCKHGTDCDRALTDDVIAEAEAWWRNIHGYGEVPIDRFGDKPECYERKD